MPQGDQNPDSLADEPRRVLREVRQRLESLRRAGLRDLPRPLLQETPGQMREAEVAQPIATDAEKNQGQADQPLSGPAAGVSPMTPSRAESAREVPPRESLPTTAPNRAGAVPIKPPPAAVAPAPSLFHEPEFDSAPVPVEERFKVLKVLAEEVAGCRKCAELAATRTQTVFADGSPSARLMFVGEAPGADEDRIGLPFVGRAGQLLTDMITKGMGLRREDVYIANILKCRPPENRDPQLEEIANCLPYLERQIDIIRPEFLCLLGRVAAQTLLETTLSMGRLRGKWYRYRGIATLVTYHPAYLLRNASSKKEAWEDLQILMNAMGLPVPSRRRNQN